MPLSHKLPEREHIYIYIYTNTMLCYKVDQDDDVITSQTTLIKRF